MRITAKRIGKYKDPYWKNVLVIEEMQRVIEGDSRLRYALNEPFANFQPEHKPKLEARVEKTGKDVIVHYVVKGPARAQRIFRYLRDGTRPHKIRAKRAPRLAFLWGGPGSYKAKTAPGGATLKFGGPGTVTGGKWHFPKEVNHPGTEPRDFDGYYNHLLAGHFAYLVNRAIRLAFEKGRRITVRY